MNRASEIIKRQKVPELPLRLNQEPFLWQKIFFLTKRALVSEALMSLEPTELQAEAGASFGTVLTMASRWRQLVVEGTTVHRVEPLPSAEVLLCAIRGHYLDDHPLARWASLLAGLHRILGDTLDAGMGRENWCSERGYLVHAIDLWVERHVPQHRRGGALHTETLGTVIDRIAAAQVRAESLLMNVATAADPSVHAAWHRLAELVDAYGDLAAEVITGSRRLPAPAGDDW
ncbi:DUF4254 domain-containing protein [Nocardia sp. CA-107356]|uniref:DUF4254 domain-containing protein n=1 Tax=Nocardia sp. CA-107356 TaxID=3239972 RepID=UPI003D8DC9EB